MFFFISQTSLSSVNCVDAVWPPGRAAGDTLLLSTLRSETMCVVFVGKALSSNCEFHFVLPLLMKKLTSKNCVYILI